MNWRQIISSRIIFVCFSLFVWAVVVSFVIAIEQPEIFIWRWSHLLAGLPLMGISWFMNNIFMRNEPVSNEKEPS